MESIENILTFEVKKELADRYFGFRKIIEDDTAFYFKNVLDVSNELETTVGHDLVRIYTLLERQELVDSFLRLTGLPDRLFVDSHINTQPAKAAIFRQQNLRGITRKGCLHNMTFDTYSSLYNNIISYRKSFSLLQEDHETICQQIDIFYRKNDIQTILQFLRTLDSSGMIHAAVPSGSLMDGEMEKKLRIQPPPPINELLPELPLIPPVKAIRGELKALISKACLHQPKLDLRSLKKRG